MRSLISMYVRTQNRMNSLLENEEGATMVEYALVVALIALAAITAVSGLGSAISSEFGKISGNLK